MELRTRHITRYAEFRSRPKYRSVLTLALAVNELAASILEVTSALSGCGDSASLACPREFHRYFVSTPKYRSCLAFLINSCAAALDEFDLARVGQASVWSKRCFIYRATLNLFKTPCRRSLSKPCRTSRKQVPEGTTYEHRNERTTETDGYAKTRVYRTASNERPRGAVAAAHDR